MIQSEKDEDEASDHSTGDRTVLKRAVHQDNNNDEQTTP